MTGLEPERHFEPAYPLATERLLLRPFTLADSEAMHAMHASEQSVRYLYWEPLSPEAARERVEQRLGRRSIHEEGDALALAVELAATGEVVGDVALTWSSRQHSRGELSFIIHPDHHGRGYATEAARLLLRIAFADLGLHRVIGRLEARNAASARVLERLGLRQEAHLVENEWVKGRWDSEIVYAILDREWQALQEG